MKDLSIYFDPINFDFDQFSKESIGETVVAHTQYYFPEISGKGAALIFIPEYRSFDNQKQTSSNLFRHKLYELFEGVNWSNTLYDLGTIHPGESLADTRYALAQVCEELMKKSIIPIVLGGGQDLTKAMYDAYKPLEQMVNLTTIDAAFDMGDIETEMHAHGWLTHILLDKQCYLFNYSNLGGQGHYLSKSVLDLFDKLYFDTNRLGALAEDITLSEPILRNTDLCSFDLSAIRFSDFKAGLEVLPNGFFANEACQLARYAGISDKLTAFGMFNADFSKEDEASAAIIAQLIWYFLDGLNNRKGDYPIASKKSYKKFRVSTEYFKEEIVFYKSNKSARWWMEVPYPDSRGSKYQRHQLVPCSYEAYKETMAGEIPDLWWKTYQKMVI